MARSLQLFLNFARFFSGVNFGHVPAAAQGTASAKVTAGLRELKRKSLPVIFGQATAAIDTGLAKRALWSNTS